jgi:hypothetical protein
MDKTTHWLAVISGAIGFYILAILATPSSEIIYGGLTLGLLGISLTPIMISKTRA